MDATVEALRRAEFRLQRALERRKRLHDDILWLQGQERAVNREIEGIQGEINSVLNRRVA